MNDTETAELKTLIERIRADGTTVLLIEHDMKLVMNVCDRLLVLDYGRPIAEGTPATVRNDARHRSVSRRGPAPVVRTKPRKGLDRHEAACSKSPLEVRYGGIRAVKGISLACRRGRDGVLVSSGSQWRRQDHHPQGHRRHARSGRATCAIAARNAPARAFELVRKGLALVPEGRGVFGQLTVAENLAMGAYIRDDGDAVSADRERMLALFPRPRRNACSSPPAHCRAASSRCWRSRAP